MSEDEFVIYSQDIQDTLRERQKKKRNNKLDKKMKKINTMLREDWGLKERLKEQLED